MSIIDRRELLPDGGNVQLNTPDVEASATFHQKCGRPSCRGYIDGAKIAFVSVSGTDAGATPWQHYDCAVKTFEETLTYARLKAEPERPGPRWEKGRQRDMVEFVMRHEHTGPVVVDFSGERPQTERYWYRVATPGEHV